MTVIYDAETGTLSTIEPQPDKVTECSIKDALIQGKIVIERLISGKTEFNEWADWITLINEVHPLGYVPTKITTNFLENLLAIIDTWLENHS